MAQKFRIHGDAIIFSCPLIYLFTFFGMHYFVHIFNANLIYFHYFFMNIIKLVLLVKSI